MNIFALDNDPVMAAQMLCDAHIRKMGIESAQMLWAALLYMNNGISNRKEYNGAKQALNIQYKDFPRRDVNGGPLLYKLSHWNHPCTTWAKTPENFTWLASHGISICKEFQFRYGKRHACQDIIEYISSFISAQFPHTRFFEAMPEKYKKSTDPVENYRNYYLNDKIDIATWKKGRRPPIWWRV